MDLFSDFITQYVFPLCSAVLTALFSYAGLFLKRLYKNVITTKQKEEIVRICVSATEQLYHTLSGEEKLQKALESASEMLSEKHLSVTPLELRMMIESCVNSLKQAA